jgi:uroporphyrinogen III methyltransferase / synthase
MADLQFDNERPLDGITVVITRARAQAASFADELERLGARAIICPTIEIVEPESYAELDQAIENLYGYDWIIFTSVNGVNYFLRRFEALGHEVGELDDLHVLAIGEATSIRLRDVFIHVDIVPEKFKAEGALRALEEYLGGRQALDRLNFLLPRAAVARDTLPDALAEAGARVDDVTAYRTVRPKTTERARVKAMLAGGAVDCITFTSSSSVINFAQLFDTMDLSQLLKGVTVACIGDVTAATATEYGLRTQIMPREFTVPAMIRAMVEYYSERKN